MTTSPIERIVDLSSPHASMSLRASLDDTRRLRERIAILEEENARLRDLSHLDELTGLGNRRSYLAQLEHSFQAVVRYNKSAAIIVLDLDGMKKLNDTCGHSAGDEALRDVARILTTHLRSADSAARLGGDEFGIVLPMTTKGGAALVAERLRTSIEAMAMPAGVRITASFGIAEIDRNCSSAWCVTERADAALYRAKRAGGNRLEIDETHASA